MRGECSKECLYRRPGLARRDNCKIIVLFGEWNKAEVRRLGDRGDGHAPIGAALRHRGSDGFCSSAVDSNNRKRVREMYR